MDRRIAKTVDGVVEAFVLDSADISDRVFDNQILRFTNGALTTRWMFGSNVDEPLSYETYTTSDTTAGSGSVSLLYADRQGSILNSIRADSGNSVSQYVYASFGERTLVSGDSQPYGYTGREHDSETGLIYLRARYYDPMIGVFLQPDPVAFQSGTLSLYGYVENDPLNFSDPSGLTRGSIRQPAAAGPASTEFQMLGKAMQVAREEAIASIAEGAFSLLLDAMGQARTTLSRGRMSPVRPEVHHCTPRSVGGSNDRENLRKIRRVRHMYVHKLMRLYMAPFRTSRARNTFIGIDISERLDKDDIAVIMRQFNRDIDNVLGIGLGC